MSELRNPHAGHGALLTPQDSALLLIEHQAFQFANLPRDRALLGVLAEVLVQHGGGSGIAFDWEMLLLGSKAKAA
jgi:hypothetical protein